LGIRNRGRAVRLWVGTVGLGAEPKVRDRAAEPEIGTKDQG
jgi:hypothetical protein